MVASSVLCGPLPQGIPVSAYARLVNPRVSLAGAVEKCVICHTHDVLA